MPVRLPVAVVVLVVGVTCGLVAVGVLSGLAGRPVGSAPVPDPAVADAAPTPALAVLQDWDRRRADAWAAGDPGALVRLYVPGSTAGASDAALLRRYRARGVAVPDLRMQLVAAAVLVDRPRRIVVRVVERLATTSARVGRRVVQLPRDAASVHVVELRRVRDTWLVAAVRG